MPITWDSQDLDLQLSDMSVLPSFISLELHSAGTRWQGLVLRVSIKTMDATRLTKLDKARCFIYIVVDKDTNSNLKFLKTGRNGAHNYSAPIKKMKLQFFMIVLADEYTIEKRKKAKMQGSSTNWNLKRKRWCPFLFSFHPGTRPLLWNSSSLINWMRWTTL